MVPNKMFQKEVKEERNKAKIRSDATPKCPAKVLPICT